MFRRSLQRATKLANRRAGTGTSGIYLTLISVCAVMSVVLLMMVAIPLWNARQVLITAAQNGSRVAAVTENQQQVLNAVQQTIQNSGLPTTYKGQPLFTVSTTNVQNGPNAPVATVTVSYTAPILFSDIFAGLGSPGKLPASIPMSVTESYINETYYGS